MKKRIHLPRARTLALTAAALALAAAPASASYGGPHDRWGVIHCDAPDQVTVHALFEGDVHLAVGTPGNGVFLVHDYAHWGKWTSHPFADGGSLEWHAADHGGLDGDAYVYRANATCDAFAKRREE